jgi:hypothetical protein
MSAHPKLVTYGEEPLPFERLLSDPPISLVNSTVNQIRGTLEETSKVLGDIMDLISVDRQHGDALERIWLLEYHAYIAPDGNLSAGSLAFLYRITSKFKSYVR